MNLQQIFDQLLEQKQKAEKAAKKYNRRINISGVTLSSKELRSISFANAYIR